MGFSHAFLIKLMIEPRSLLAVDSKIKTKIAKIAITLFMLIVDAPIRLVLVVLGFVYSYGMIVFWGDYSPIEKLSNIITGIAGIRAGCRALPYDCNPPYLHRKIINKWTTVIPLCVFGIAVVSYDLFREYREHGAQKLDPGLCIYVIALTYAIVETIILKRVVLALGNTNEALASDISMSSRRRNAYITKLQNDGSIWWLSGLTLMVGAVAFVLLTILCYRLFLLSETDLLAMANSANFGMSIVFSYGLGGVWIFFFLNIIFIWGVVDLHFARSYLFKRSMENLPEGAEERVGTGVAFMCDIFPVVVLAGMIGAYYERLQPLIF